MGRHPSSDSRSSISSVSARSGPSFSRSRSQNTANSGASRSSRGSRSSRSGRSGRSVGSSRRGQRIKSDIYRRHALINSTRRRIAKEQDRTAFQKRSQIGVVSRREVAVVGGNVTITECTAIYHAKLTEDELNKAMKDAMEKKTYSQAECLEKRLKMKTFYGKEMIVIERELNLRKNDFEIPFENGEEHNGSLAKQEDSRSDVSLLAGFSVRSDGRNLSFEETLKISFDRGEEENLTRRNSTYRMRRDEPNSDETTQIKETLFADENTMVLSCIFDLQSISQDSSIAEFREYVCNTCELKELTIIHPSPDYRRNLDNTVFLSFNGSNKSAPGERSSGSSGSGLYESAQSRRSWMDSGRKSISHQEALQSPRSPRPSVAVSPRLILPQVIPERRTSSALSTTAPAILPNAPKIVNLTMGQIAKPTIVDHHHLLKLNAHIDGSPYEFVAKITFQAAPGVNFVLRRVMLDSNVLWQHSSEWNPTTSVSSSQANMSIEHSKTLPH